MLSPKQAFKAAFIRRCLDRGADPKLAAESLTKQALGLGTAALPAMALLAAPPILSYLGGRAAGNLVGASGGDTIEDLRHKELLDELQRQTEASERRRLVNQYNRPAKLL